MEPGGRPRRAEDRDDIETLNLHGLRTADYIRAEHLLSDDQKSALATRLAAALDASDGNPDDSANAEAILRLIVWNAAPPVVESLAQAAAGNPNTPHDLAWALANDDESAARPILEASHALSDTDLVAIVEATKSFAKMTAIARRDLVSEIVSRSLARHGDETTVHSLLTNARADIPEDAFACILDRHGRHERIQEGMIDREAISLAIVDRLMGLVGAGLAAKVEQRRQALRATGVASAPGRAAGAPPGYSDDLGAGDLDEPISRMIADGAITPSLLVSKLCGGNFEFFASAVSAMAKSPKDEACVRLQESPATHLPELWKRAALPGAWLPIARAALSALIHIERNYSKTDPQIFRRNIIDRTQALLKADNYALSDTQRRFFRSL